MVRKSLSGFTMLSLLCVAGCAEHPRSPSAKRDGAIRDGGGGTRDRATPDSAGRSDGQGGIVNPPTSTRFKIISYNVQARPLLDASRATVNLPIIGRLLGEYDVGGVEECFSLCEKLLDAAPQPHHYYFSEREHPWSLANSGLAGVSRFEIEEVVTTFYQHEADIADVVASKGVVLTRIHVGGFPVDVYNTHMQAGDTDGAHVAQSFQADELVAFIAAHTPSSHTLVLHGDFNMSPARPGKRFEDFTPNHYSNEADMLSRTTSFQKVIDQLHLNDASDVLFGPVRDHIDRVLYRAAAGVKVTPLSWEDRGPLFVDPSGASLSDSMPLVVELALESTP